MKWILLMVMVSFPQTHCDQGDFKNEISTGDENKAMGFGSNEDESVIHLHIWNDMDSSKNFYPNLMKHIMTESMQKESTQSPSQADNSDAIHINLNEPILQAQVSPENLLKNALLKTLTMEFRKSDQNLYGSYNKLASERFNQNPIDWNYHPSMINYIPKAFDTNTNTNNAVPMKSTQQRPSLYNRMPTANKFVQSYYTNLHKTKPKSIIDAVGYEIGGLPKCSGRLLANEPMPQQYHTFKMFEPVPRQIMLPPPIVGIPEFKRVPPRLKSIPVIDDYLDTRFNSVQAPKQTPWKVIEPNHKTKPLHYLMPTKPKQIIPFQVSEAMTKSPLQKYIPKSEFNESPTESYYKERFNYAFEKIVPEIVTKTPKLNIFSSIQSDQKHENVINAKSPYSLESLQNAISENEVDTNHQNKPISNTFTNEGNLVGDTVTTNHNHNHNYNIDNEAPKLVSMDDFRSTFDTKKRKHRTNNDELTRMKNARRKLKVQKSHENITNGVIKLNVTGFRNATEDNRVGEHGDTSDNNAPKYENSVRNYDKLRLHASNEYPIDNVPADSIQLSQAYSRQITNVPHSNPASTRDSNDNLSTQLVNDVEKTVNSLENGKNSSNFDNLNGIQGSKDQQEDPFLIAIFDEQNRKYDPQIRLDDLHLDEIDRSDSFVTANGSNNLLQWTDDGTTNLQINQHRKVLNVDKRDETNNENTNKHSAKHMKNSSNEKQNERKKIFMGEMNAEENKKFGRTVISEHFKKVEIEPNISWIVLPR